MLFLKKIKEAHLRQFINEWNIDQAQWLGLSVNTSEVRGANQNIQLEGNYYKKQHMIQWAQEDQNSPYLRLIRNHKRWKESKVNLADKDVFTKVMSGVLHLQMLRTREHLIQMAHAVPELEPQNVPQIQGEDKALEWVKVSFVVLKKALEQALKDKDSTLQMMLFSGLNQKEELRFKLRIYNLDITLEKMDQHLEIIVFDKKGDEDFKPEHQVLKSPIYKLINPIIDEIIQLRPLTEKLAKKKVIGL